MASGGNNPPVGGASPADRSMGDQFLMNRSAGGGAAQGPSSNNSRARSGGGGGSYHSSGSGSNSYHSNNNYNNNNNSSYRRGGGGGYGGGGGGYGGGGGGSRRGEGRGGDRGNFRSSLPSELGKIRTLKESFGFITPVDRPDDVFFHFSELHDVSIAELSVGDAVEFKVRDQQQSGDTSKLSAVDVRKCDDSVELVWEVALGRARGIVDRSVPPRPPYEGSIRVVVDSTTGGGGGGDDEDKAAPNDEGNSNQPPEPNSPSVDSPPSNASVEKPEGPVCKFTPRDYKSDEPNAAPPSSSAGGTSRMTRFFGSNSNATSNSNTCTLARGDLVEFDLVLWKRTKEHQARNIVLIRSEQQRLQEERERKLLETAVEEEGVVTSLKGEYGFIRSNKRREEVYFHYSSVELGGADGDGDAVLQEGQELKFLVVNHGAGSHDGGPGGEGGGPGARRGSGAGKQRVSARRVSLQPRGSVKFHDALACGVTGVVVQCPQPVDAGHSLEARGRVRLAKPVTLTTTTTDENDGTTKSVSRVVTEVYLASADSPGGTYAFRGGSSVATWVQLGDTLLFDVVKDYVDGACHAEPTIHLVPNPTPDEMETENPDDVRKVRLIEVSKVGRAEGEVNAVKESYGFLHFAERPVDVHFKLYQLLPDELQADIRRNRGLADVDQRGRPLRLSPGTEAEFDISVHGTIHATSTHTSKSIKKNNDRERENLKAQRVLLLPPNTVQFSHVLAKGVRGTIVKVDTKQAYTGMLDLSEPIPPIPLEVRHPIVSRMLDEYLTSDLEIPLLYHDVQSAREDSTVFEMIEHKNANDILTWSHIPQAGAIGYPGRLCIRKADVPIQAVVDCEGGVSPPPVDDTAKTELSTRDELSADGSDADDDNKSQEDAEAGEDASQDGKKRRKPRKRAGVKLIRSVRYDKASLSSDLRNGVPPAIDDVVEFDVVQSRRTMQVTIENLTIVERKNPDALAAVVATDGVSVGVVNEVVVARNFGFIAVLDESSTEREMIFFSLSNVVGVDGNAEKSRNKKSVLRKGDEVKFEMRSENGKRVAFNVMPLPKGTIPSKADKDACRGIILLEPSSTKLKANGASPFRHSSSVNSAASSNDGSSSRWDSVSEDRGKKTPSSAEPTIEDGYILLLDDPSASSHPKPALMEEPTVPVTTASQEIAVATSIEPVTGSIKLDDSSARRVAYGIGSLAIHGQGATTGNGDAAMPRRGDVVTFLRSKKFVNRARDVRVVERGAATLIRGRLEGISGSKANFIAATEGEEGYEIDLSESVGCEASLLKEKESVEGVLHDGKIYGIARTADLYLESKVRVGGFKERPRLNLTVKKDRGGTIMAQSMMAKGPDGTIGFALGWTKRVSKFAGSVAVEPVPITTQTVLDETALAQSDI